MRLPLGLFSLRIFATLWLAVTAAGLSQVAVADDYPSRPITLVVPFPPGGSTTVMARNVADKMSAALGQSIVVENRGGAGGTLGTRYVAKATPDGYTILLSYTGTFSIVPTAYGNPGYDPRKDFAPIGMIGAAPNLLVVNPSVPVHSMAELIVYIKAQTSPMQFGSPGVGTVNHLAGEMLAKRYRRLHAAHSLQGQRPGARRSDWRPYSDDVHADPGGAR